MTDEELIDYATPSLSTFADLMLKDTLLDSITQAEFDHPSSIQQKCLPKALLGTDLLCQARSGTGKTVIFVLSTLNQLTDAQIASKETAILVVVHTHELADQIRSEYVRFGKHLQITVDTFIGGVDVQTDIRKLRDGQPVVVIGTVGRLSELVRMRYMSLRHVRHLVVDEVDHLMGNLRQRELLQKIVYKTPVKKQTMFFSATLSEEIKKSCLLFMKNGLVVIEEERKLSLHGLIQKYVMIGCATYNNSSLDDALNDSRDNTNERRNTTNTVSINRSINSNNYIRRNIVNPEAEREKERLLVKILDNEELSQCVIFTNSCAKSSQLSRILNHRGFPTTEIHSQLSHDERLRRFQRFRELKFRVLVATDLMARGIDVQDVNLVVNYDMPGSAEIYLHRVGRAGRFETRGLAVSFLQGEADMVVMNDVQSRYGVSVGEYSFK